MKMNELIENTFEMKWNENGTEMEPKENQWKQ